MFTLFDIETSKDEMEAQGLVGSFPIPFRFFGVSGSERITIGLLGRF